MFCCISPSACNARILTYDGIWVAAKFRCTSSPSALVPKVRFDRGVSKYNGESLMQCDYASTELQCQPEISSFRWMWQLSTAVNLLFHLAFTQDVSSRTFTSTELPLTNSQDSFHQTSQENFRESSPSKHKIQQPFSIPHSTFLKQSPNSNPTTQNQVKFLYILNLNGKYLNATS